METDSNESQREKNPFTELDRMYAHRKHLVGKTIERDGKYYQQFIDGEREVTPEYIKEMSSKTTQLVRLIENNIERYDRNDWTVRDLPKDIDSFSKVDLFIEDLETAFSQLINKGGIAATWPKLCLVTDVLVSKAEEMQYDYSPHSTQLRAYLRAKLQSLRTRWESIYQLSSKQKNTPATFTPPASQKTNLIQWFDMPGKYPVIMGLLVEKGICQTGTYLWIDESAGAKTAVATLIKYLHAQGFFTDNTKPSNEEIVLVAKQTFGVVMGIDTVKKAKVPTSANHNFSFISPASTY